MRMLVSLILTRFHSILQQIADAKTNLPHMLPSITEFQEKIGQMGIENSDSLVVYDSMGVGPACRAYWTFKVFGHENVAVMDGGLPKWLRENKPVSFSAREPRFELAKYSASFNGSFVKDYNQILQVLGTEGIQILDARPRGRFEGKDPEPRPGLPSGHMPGSINIPSNSLVDPATNTLLPREELIKLLTSKDVDLNKPVICSCGSGVTASVIFFVLELIGAKEIAVYDGSWAEYASKASSKIETI